MILRMSALTTVLTVSTLIAGACGTIYSGVKSPQNGDVIPSGQFKINGWALECASGKRPPVYTVSFWNMNTQEWWFPQSFKLVPKYRHDVVLFFQDKCPAGDWSTGYELKVIPNPPPGHYKLYVQWANYYGAKDNQIRDIDVAYD